MLGTWEMDRACCGEEGGRAVVQACLQGEFLELSGIYVVVDEGSVMAKRKARMGRNSGGRFFRCQSKSVRRSLGSRVYFPSYEE